MDADELGAADGQVRPDHMWVRRLQRLMGSTPIAATALEALAPLAAFADFSIEWDDLRFVVEEEEKLWRNQGNLSSLTLPSDFMRFALAIYVYSGGPRDLPRDQPRDVRPGSKIEGRRAGQ